MSPREYLESDYLENLKQKFLNNEYDEETCSGCKKLEDNGLQSIRQHMLKIYGNDSTTGIDYMELRASNLCNFKCIMCNSANSSLWAGKVDTITNNNWQEILDTSLGLKHLTLTGGEPMLIKHYYELLDHLIENNKTKVWLRIYTNASVYNSIFVEKMLKFKTSLNLSIDAVGEIAERQREGTTWSVVDANIQKFIKLPCQVKFHMTFTKLSILGIKETAEYFVKAIENNPNVEFVAHTATKPNHLSVFELSADLIPKVQDDIDYALSILTNNSFAQLSKQLLSYKKMLATKLANYI
jgi:sulfatase maturation enzyme AslB (radical SAM superfamily)